MAGILQSKMATKRAANGTHSKYSEKLFSVADGSWLLSDMSYNIRAVELTQVWYVSGLQVAQRNKFFIHDHKCVNLFHYINFHRNIPNLCQFYSSTVLRHIRKRPTSICYRKQFRHFGSHFISVQA